jgi:hypothetical protein
VTFKPNHAGIGEMLRSDFMEAEMARRAGKVLAVCEATAPYDPAIDGDVHYRDQFRVESTRAGGVHKDRAEATVINDHPASFQIEMGTGDTPKHRTMGRAIDAAKE